MADNMERFLMFQLSRGPGILSEESLRMTHALQFSQTGHWPGMALGWVDERRTGRRMLEHSGGTPSYMAIFPDHDVGVFIALNRRDSGARIGMLIELWNRFLPAVASEALKDVSADPGRPLADYAGDYRNSNFPMGDMQKVPGYLGLYYDLVAVKPVAAGLLIDGRVYRLVGEDQFRREGTDLIERFDFSGPVLALLKGRFSYDRVVRYERPAIIGSFLVGLIVLSLYAGGRGVSGL